MKAKFNAGLTIDNKHFPPGENEVTQSQFDIASKLDVNGLPLVTGSTQDPLCVKIESNDKPKVQG